VRTLTVDYAKDYPAERRPRLAKKFVLWTGGENEKRRRSHHVAVHVARRLLTPDVGVQVRFDSEHAETPVDAHLTLGPVQVFAGTEWGRRLNRWLRVPDGSSRAIGAEVRAGEGGFQAVTLVWSLWTDPEHQVLSRHERARLGRWYAARRGYVHPVGAVLDRLLGKAVYGREVLAEAEGVAWLPEGGYPLLLKLERATWKRPRSRRAMVRTTVDYRVVSRRDGGPGLIPDGGDSFGSADGTVGSSSRELTETEARDRSRWVAVAEHSAVELTLGQRARERSSGWVPAAADVPPGVLAPRGQVSR
jgi:hypothetical protein